MKQIKPLVLNREKRCHICSSWTSLNGCAHYGPQDYDQNKPIIDAITKAVHGDNGNIVETSDFYAGVNAALLVLRQNNLIQAGQSAVQDATPESDRRFSKEDMVNFLEYAALNYKLKVTRKGEATWHEDESAWYDSIGVFENWMFIEDDVKPQDATPQEGSKK